MKQHLIGKETNTNNAVRRYYNSKDNECNVRETFNFYGDSGNVERLRCNVDVNVNANVNSNTNDVSLKKKKAARNAPSFHPRTVSIITLWQNQITKPIIELLPRLPVLAALTRFTDKTRT